MMAMQIRALELHYPMMQFLIISDTLRPRNNTVKPRKSRHGRGRTKKESVLAGDLTKRVENVTTFFPQGDKANCP